MNEGQVAESMLTAIMGRMSAYTGRALNWDWVMNASKLDLTPPHLELGDAPALEVPIPTRMPPATMAAQVQRGSLRSGFFCPGRRMPTSMDFRAVLLVLARARGAHGQATLSHVGNTR